MPFFGKITIFSNNTHFLFIDYITDTTKYAPIRVTDERKYYTLLMHECSRP